MKKEIIARDEAAGLEWYKNADGKIVQQGIDLYKDYRRGDLAPEINNLLDALRSEHTYPKKSTIDKIAGMDPAAGVAWINWRFYGAARPGKAENAKKFSEQENIENNLNQLRKEVLELREDLKKVLEYTEKMNNDYIKSYCSCYERGLNHGKNHGLQKPADLERGKRAGLV